MDDQGMLVVVAETWRGSDMRIWHVGASCCDCRKALMVSEQIIAEASALDDYLICCRDCARKQVPDLPVTGVAVSGSTVTDHAYGTIRDVVL
jgi:hypothetical protein